MSSSRCTRFSPKPGAWIAVTGHWSWAAFALGIGVGLWIGGRRACKTIVHPVEYGRSLRYAVQR